MAKSLNLGNGKLLVGLDRFGQVKDFYYPYCGLENHIGSSMVHKIGIMVDGYFSWLDDLSWDVKIELEEETMASKISISRLDLGIQIHFVDVVYNEEDIFVREVTLHNLFEKKREIKIFFNQQFNISLSKNGDTAYYDPVDHVIIHYKGRRVFLVNLKGENLGIDGYSVGLLGIEGKDGTYKDAEDGLLSKNPVEHGQVDSVVQSNFDLVGSSKLTFYYWIIAAKSIKKAKFANEMTVARGAKEIIKTTKDYWKAWVNIQRFNFYKMSDPLVALFKRSLFYIRTHVSKNGSIIASGDSDMLQFGRDTYAYVWPRDGAFISIALAKAGDFNAAKRFLSFCNDIVSEKGYFMHKYRPDKSLGSSWHPWISNGKKHLPIQEDETALVLYALWKYFELSRDIEFIEQIYNSFIKKTADFMVHHRDDKTGLPSPSYDLWEQDYGIHTFTSSSVYAALVIASKFANIFGKEKSANLYSNTAESIKKAILKYLYSDQEEMFYRSLISKNDQFVFDKNFDLSSVYGVFKFGILPINDPVLHKVFEKTILKLRVNTGIGGYARFELDQYHHKGGDYPGNPWVITTMWVAQYYLEKAGNEADLSRVQDLLLWVADLASPAGTLPEQFDPYTGGHLSASPLIWSHAEYVVTVIDYLKKLEDLGICKTCYPLY
ncbi:MAG: glycoside hydrolase family 15 protein [Patescibacteria group bacterium]|nr:glycoside hydrolase family 15 protein [Patescibacteria group bacterium]